MNENEDKNMNDIIKTSLPLSPSTMVKFFKDKDQLFLIDYNESVKNLTPKSMLIYLSNLQITCEFTDISIEFIEEYIYLKDVCNIPMLDIFLADCIHYIKYNEPFVNSELFVQYGPSIIEKHIEILSHYLEIFDSSTLFLFSDINEIDVSNENNITYDKPIGFCFLNLYKIPDFLIVLLKEIKPIEEQTYFENYFDNENYMFKGQNLFGYFANDNNLFFKYSMLVQNVIFEPNKLDLDQLVNIHKQL